jgi:hypothetical protein
MVFAIQATNQKMEAISPRSSADQSVSLRNMPDWCNGLARRSTKPEEKVRIFYRVLTLISLGGIRCRGKTKRKLKLIDVNGI